MVRINITKQQFIQFFVALVLCVATTNGAQSSPRNRLSTLNSSCTDQQVVGLCRKQEHTNDRFELSRKYLEEYESDSFKLVVEENTIDERLASQARAQEAYRAFDGNVNSFDHFDTSVRQEYEVYTSGPEVDAASCSKHLGQMIELLDELDALNQDRRLNPLHKNATLDRRHIHFARVLDSFGRYESGALSGRLKMIGSSTQCLETKLILGPRTAQQVVGTRICSAKLTLDKYLDNDYKLLTEPELSKYKSSLEVKICLPNSCHSDSLRDNKGIIQRLINSQFHLPETIYVDRHREVVDLFCLNDGNTNPLSIPTSGKVLIGLVLIWIAILFYGTCYSGKLESSDSRVARVIAEHFNLRTQLEQFTGFNREHGVDFTKERVDVSTLSFVKVICVILIVYGHSCLLWGARLSDILRGIAIPFRDSALAWTYTITMIVDVFFVMSGMFIVLIAMKRFKYANADSSLATHIGIYFKTSIFRYIRLVPIYFLVIWFKKSIWIYLTTGFFTDKGFNQHTLGGGCKQESLLTHVFGLTPYLPMTTQCLFQSWSLGCEILFSLIAPLLIIGFLTKARLTVFLSSALALATAILSFETILNLEPSFLKIAEGFNGDIVILPLKQSDFYTNFHLRGGALLVGCIAGYALHQYQTGSIKRWPHWFRVHVTLAASFIWVQLILNSIFLAYLKAYMFRPLPAMEKNLYPNVFVFNKFIASVAWAVLMTRLTTDWKNYYLIRLLSGHTMQVLGKLTFIVYLLHVDTITYLMDARDSYFNSASLVVISDITIATLVYTSLIGVVIMLFFEGPISGLIKAMQTRRTEESEKKTSFVLSLPQKDTH